MSNMKAFVIVIASMILLLTSSLSKAFNVNFDNYSNGAINDYTHYFNYGVNSLPNYYIQVPGGGITGGALIPSSHGFYMQDVAVLKIPVSNPAAVEHQFSMSFLYDSSLVNHTYNNTLLQVNFEPYSDEVHYIAGRIGGIGTELKLNIKGYYNNSYNDHPDKPSFNLIDKNWYQLLITINNTGDSFGRIDVSIELFNLGMTGTEVPISVDSDFLTTNDPTFAESNLQIIIYSEQWGGASALDNFFVNIIDNDSDGLFDGEEQGPDGNEPNYDGNDDGIADSLQDNVASFYTYSSPIYVTMETPLGTSINNFKTVGIPSLNKIPLNFQFPYGFLEFTINGVSKSSSTTAVLHFPIGETFDSYYKFGPSSDNTTDHWYEFLSDGQTGAVIRGNIINLHLTDGMRGDDDLAANGAIIDTGGPAINFEFPPPPPAPGSGFSIGTHSGCFIATAAYGSLMEPHVKILREFRDRFLLGNTIGDRFVRLYYTYSPPIADFIAEHDSLRAMVRISLFPVVGISWVALKLGPTSAMAVMLLFVSIFIGFIWFRRKHKA